MKEDQGQTLFHARSLVALCEDDVDLRALLASALATLSVDVVAAGSAEACAALVEGRRPDLLITDVHLPGHDGVWLADALRRRDPDLHVVYVSGEAAGASLPLAAQGADFLPKPFDLRALLDRVRALLRRRARSAVRRPPSRNGPFARTRGARRSARGIRGRPVDIVRAMGYGSARVGRPTSSTP